MKTGDQIRFMRNTQGSRSVTIGKIYTITGMGGGGNPFIINDIGENGWYTGSQFDLVDENDIFNKIASAKEMIGKTIKVISSGNTFVPDSWGITNQYSLRSFDKADMVYLEDQFNIASIDEVEVVSNVIKLTDDYNAVVEKDFVKVGCQNVPIEKVREILKVWDSLY